MSDRIVSIADRAIDSLKMGIDLQKYATHRDPETLKFRMGEAPTWFVLRPVPVSVFRRVVRAESSESMQAMRAFQVGVEAIEGYVQPDGRVVTIHPRGSVRGATGDHPAWTDEELDLFPDLWLEELGGIVWQRSFLGVPNAAPYPVPPSLLRVLVARVRQDAEQIQREARESKREPPPDTDPAKTTRAEPPSAEATGATAMESATS